MCSQTEHQEDNVIVTSHVRSKIPTWRTVPLQALFHRLDENGVGSCAPEADGPGSYLEVCMGERGTAEIPEYD